MKKKRPKLENFNGKFKQKSYKKYEQKSEK